MRDGDVVVLTSSTTSVSGTPAFSATTTPTRSSMTISIETLLERNMREVFGEHDAVKRQAAVAVLFTDHCVFIGPDGRHEGRSAIADAAAAIQQRFPAFTYSMLNPPQSIDRVGRLAWASGPPDAPRKVTGMDIVVVREGRIASLYTFLDRA